MVRRDGSDKLCLNAVRYYQDLGIVNDAQEWQAMYDKFHAPLPVTFRFTALVSAEFRRTGERLVARCAGARRIHVADGWQLREDKWALRSAPPSSPQVGRLSPPVAVSWLSRRSCTLDSRRLHCPVSCGTQSCSLLCSLIEGDPSRFACRASMLLC
eukprot:6210667-Pleurochrysis_carterae.AAC.2